MTANIIFWIWLISSPIIWIGMIHFYRKTSDVSLLDLLSSMVCAFVPFVNIVVLLLWVEQASPIIVLKKKG
jgi:hypothetical protein